MNLRTTIKRPSAFVPVAMSFAALAIVLVHIIMSGTAQYWRCKRSRRSQHLRQFIYSTDNEAQTSRCS